MIDDEQNIRDFVNYGSNKFSSPSVVPLFSLLEACFFAVIYFVSDRSLEVQIALFGMIFFAVYSLFIFIYSALISKYEKDILIGYINNCILIFSFSLFSIYMLIFVLVHMDADLLNYVLCVAIYLLFSLFSIVNTKRKIMNGVYGEYLKPRNNVNPKLTSAIIIVSALVAVGIRISVKYVTQSAVMIIFEVLLMILLLIYSIGNANYLKVYYILKYNIK